MLPGALLGAMFATRGSWHRSSNKKLVQCLTEAPPGPPGPQPLGSPSPLGFSLGPGPQLGSPSPLGPLGSNAGGPNFAVWHSDYRL